MKTKRSMWLVVLLGGMTCSSYAAGVPHFTIERVTEEATLIVVGDITEIKDLGAAHPLQFRGQWLHAEAYAADISVRRTIKGPISDHITVSYSLPIVFNGYHRLQPGTRMVFLSGQGKILGLADPYYTDFPAVPDAGCPISRVVCEKWASPCSSVTDIGEIPTQNGQKWKSCQAP